jgi:excisionase family DNA binding protein
MTKGSKGPKSTKGPKAPKAAESASPPNPQPVRRRQRGKSVRGGKLGYSVEEAGEMLGISRASAYAGVRAGDIPSVKVGSLLIVPKTRFHEIFGPLPEATNIAA